MRIKVISPESRRGAQMAQLLGQMDPALEVLSATAPPQSLLQAVNGSQPSLVVVDGVDGAALPAVGRFTQAHPQIEMLVLSSDQSSDFLLRAMQAGVREVLPTGVDAASLRAAVQRATRRQLQPAAAAPEGQVVAFLGGKGGNGTSVLAANLAQRLAATTAQRVALVDLHLQSGDALLLLSDQRPGSDVAEVARHVHRLDGELLRAAMVPVGERLHVLAAPEDIGQALEVQAAHVEAIVQQARRLFDVVVLDLGAHIDALSLQALDLATQVFVVLQPTLPQLRDARRLRALLQSLEVPAHKLHWLVNRHDRRSELPLQVLSQALGGAPLRTVPNHFASVSAAVHHGLPIDPGSPVVRALDALAHGLVPQPAPRREGWLSQLLGRR